MNDDRKRNTRGSYELACRWARVTERLAAFYGERPELVEAFMITPQALLDGREPRKCEPEEVEAMLAAIDDGAYL